MERYFDLNDELEMCLSNDGDMITIERVGVHGYKLTGKSWDGMEAEGYGFTIMDAIRYANNE